MKNIIYCPSCDNSTSLISFNSRIMRYECLACELIIILNVHGKYNPKKQLEMKLNASGKAFKLYPTDRMIPYGVPVL